MRDGTNLLTPDSAGFMRVYTRGELEGAWPAAGFGVAWYDVVRGTAVCFPVGVHLIVAAGRRIWHWLRARARPSCLDAAYARGVTDGRAQQAQWVALEYRRPSRRRTVVRPREWFVRQAQKDAGPPS